MHSEFSLNNLLEGRYKMVGARLWTGLKWLRIRSGSGLSWKM